MSTKVENPLPIQFGEWRPDTAFVNTPHLTECTGVVASGEGYAPMKALTSVQSNQLTGTALDGWGIGYGSLLDIVAGTATKLWALPTAVAWVDISRSVGGNYAATYWDACKFGTQLIMVNGVDAPQTYTIGTQTANSATALSGSPPTFSYIATCGDFVFGLGTTASDASKRTIRWSGFGDATSWTVGTDLCDEQEFPDGGDVLGAVGDKQGFIIQRDAVRRFNFIPGDIETIFQFEKIEGLPGAIAHYAFAVLGNTIYYVSHSGVIALNDQGARYIGVDRVDQYFKTNYTASKRAVADVFTGRVFFPLSGTQWVVYDSVRDRWSLGTEGTVTVSAWLRRMDATTSARTYPLAIPTTGELYGLNGSNQAATLTTADFEPIIARKCFVNGWRVQTDATTFTPTDTTKELLSDSGTANSATFHSTTGEAQGKFSGRFHKIKTVIPAGTTWTYAMGLTTWPQPDGEF